MNKYYNDPYSYSNKTYKLILMSNLQFYLYDRFKSSWLVILIVVKYLISYSVRVTVKTSFDCTNNYYDLNLPFGST